MVVDSIQSGRLNPLLICEISEMLLILFVLRYVISIINGRLTVSVALSSKNS